MRSIWTILLSVIVWIGRLARQATKATLICVISVAMWLPVCLTAETAVAADNANASSVSNNSNSSNNLSDNTSSADDAQASAFQGFPNSSTSVTSENPFKELGSNLGSGLLSQYGSQYGSQSASAYKNMSLLERAAETANAQAQNREPHYEARETYEEYRPGCGKDYARGECFTTTGDGAGARATNGHDLDVNSKGYKIGSGPVNGAVEYPRGHYENGPVDEDPSGTNHFAKTYFTPYPKGTYIMKRLRDMTISPQGNGTDVYRLPLDDVADFVFVKRTPKLNGGGFVWDVIFNMGGRTQGAGAALNYFTVPKGQILDKGSEGGRQYVQRVLYTGREETALYKKEHNLPVSRETCSFSWDNPNGLCSKSVDSSDFAPGDDLVAAWDKMNTRREKVGGYSNLLPESISSDDLTSEAVIGSCSEGKGLVCISSSNYASPDDSLHKIAPTIEGSGSKGYTPAYTAIAKNLYKSIEINTQRVFSFVNKVYTNKITREQEVPYTYKIHFTTSTQPGHENDSFFYAAGSYYGRRHTGGFYGMTDPFGNAAHKYSLMHFGRNPGKYMYTTMFQQWYGAPKIMDVQAPRFHFLKGTGLGPYNGDNGNYIAAYQITFSSMLLGLVNKPLNSPLIQVNKDIRLLPDYYSSSNEYARGNQWFRNPGVGDYNTKDSTPGRHKLQLKYSNDYYRISETQDLWYSIITQKDVFKPLQTEEWIDDRTSQIAPKYYSYDNPLPDPKDFVKFVSNRNHLYNQVRAFDPNLFLPINTNVYGDRIKYGSVKQEEGRVTAYPLDEGYKDSNANDASDKLRENAVYKVEWTDKWGEKSRSNTLQDAEKKIAAKVPIISVVNPCAHSKILDEYKDDLNGQSRSSISFRSADSNDNSAVNGDRAVLGENRGSRMPECWPKPQEATKRKIWYFANAPKNAKQGDDVAEANKNALIKSVKRKYRTYMMNNDSAQLQNDANGNAVDPEVLPKVVFVKYAKITFWDNSTTVIPIVFAYVDYEKPTLDVKVSINNGKPVSAPEDGLRVGVKSKIKFWVNGHDDRKILLGVMDSTTVKKYVGNKFRDDFKMINDDKVREEDDTDLKGGGAFSSIKYNKFTNSDAYSNGIKPNTDTDQIGWIENSTLTKDNGSPTVTKRDQGTHDLIFHGWDAAGNSVFKKVRLIIIDGDLGLPNVWWQKRTKNNPNDPSKNYNYYVGRVDPWSEDKQVRSIMVRIWARGKNKPLTDDDKAHTFDQKCPTDGSCYGIIIQRDGLNKPWHQVNIDGNSNNVNVLSNSNSVQEDRSVIEDRSADKDKSVNKDKSNSGDKSNSVDKDKSNSVDKSTKLTQSNNNLASLKTYAKRENRKQVKNSKFSKNRLKSEKRNVLLKRNIAKFASFNENNGDNNGENNIKPQDAANSKNENTQNNVKNNNAENNNNQHNSNNSGENNSSNVVSEENNADKKNNKLRSKRDLQNKDEDNNKTKNESEKQDRSASNERSSTNTSDEQLKAKYAKRVITDLKSKIVGCDPQIAPDGKCEITFNPQTGSIEIPEYFAEIGSRIYVDAGTVTVSDENKVQTSLWDVTGASVKSEPLPLKMTWPNGLVQVSPFELNDAETGALLTWMRHDPKNYRLFGYRKEEVGIKGEDKYDIYNKYDSSSRSFTYAYGESSPKYSCKADKNHASDLQWKLCLDINPRRGNAVSDSADIKNMAHAKKDLTFNKLETRDKTELNPSTHKVTRFVDMRKDYEWSFTRKNLSDRTSDPGFEWHGSQKYGTQYLVYKWNINTGKRLNTDFVLDLIKGVPVIPDKANKPQPSLIEMNGSKNKHDILYGKSGNDGWDGINKLPKRGTNYGYAPKDGVCSTGLNSKGKYDESNIGKCQWQNVLDLVKYTSEDHGNYGSFADDVNVNMKDGEKEVSITDKDYIIRKNFLMPGGKYLNGQSDGDEIGDIITKNRSVRLINDYDGVPHKSGESSGDYDNRYFANRPFMHAQLYVHNGAVMNDILFRVEGDQDTTTNVINVWFMPVDGQKPTISGKSYPEGNKAWNIHGSCMLPGHDKKDCTPVDKDLIDLDNNDWYNTDTGTLLLPENLKLDDDFNAYTPTGSYKTGKWPNIKTVETGQSSKALLGNLQIDIVANNVKDASGRTSSPRVRFVRDGVVDKHLVRRFIEKYRSTDLKDPDPNKPTEFSMYAKTTDSSGKESDETSVGCFKAKWEKQEEPMVVAYDSNNHDLPTNKDDSWLKQSANAMNEIKRSNDVLVKANRNAKRMVVYFHPAADVANTNGANGNSGNNGANGNNGYGIGRTIAICWTRKGLWQGWQVCEGYESEAQKISWFKEDKNGGVGYNPNTGEIHFPAYYLAPGSVVRARSHAGSYGPWSEMPGVRTVEELANSQEDRHANDPNRSNKSRSAKPRTVKGRTVKDAISEDNLDVMPMEYDKTSKVSQVCRPDNISANDWYNAHHPSDCVYFDVAMNRRIVQVHPMLLGGGEKRAIRMELSKENHRIGKWLQNNSDITSNDDVTLGPGETMVTFRQNDYDTNHNPHVDKPKNFPEDNYGSRAGNVQDVAVMTRGWRSRVLVPLPRINQITRFVRLRAPKVDTQYGSADQAADYLVDAPTSYEDTKTESKARRVKDRPDDPGFVLSKDKKSLLYLYNVSTKHQFSLNDLQSALTLKRNDALHPANECGTYVDGNPWKFADCQPSLPSELQGSDKVYAEKSEHGFSFDNSTKFYMYDQSADDRNDSNSEKPDFRENWFVNIVDMITKSGDGGSHVITNSAGVASESSNTGFSLTNFNQIGAWGRSGAIDSSLISHKILKNPDNDLSVVMTLGDSWVSKTLSDTRGQDSTWDADANSEAVMPVYLIPVDNVKPTVKAVGALKGTTVKSPYGIDVNNIDFTLNTVSASEANKHSDSSILQEGGKEKLIDAYDDYDTRAAVKKNLKVYVRRLNGGNPQEPEWAITKQDGSVDAEALKNLLVQNHKTAIYAVYAQTEDNSGNKSEGYGASKDDKSAILGYIRLGGINVKPVPLPFTGGQAAVIYTFMFGVLLAMFIASGAFGRRGWLTSLLSGNGFSGELTYSKHCNVSAESLRCGRLFGGGRLFDISRLFDNMYKNRH
ncbi:hypothetical protein ACMZ7W_04505 [Gardnerella vaginalis]|uniref:hypothetical protein n=1 Tax=Gardnerella vaginalis TaxID=2702 RepID=UPI0039F0D0AE